MQKKTLNCAETIFSTHAVTAMIKRGISADAIIEVLTGGEIIADYATDKPYPSKLLLNFISGQAMHVVVAEDGKQCIIITCYFPDPALWNRDFKTKIK